MGTTCSLCSPLHVVELTSSSNEQRHHQQQQKQQQRFQQHQNHPFQQQQNHNSQHHQHHPHHNYHNYQPSTDLPFLDHQRKQNTSRGQYHLLYKKGKEPMTLNHDESNQKESFPSTVTKLVQRRVKSDGGGGMGTHIYAVRYPAPEQQQQQQQQQQLQQQQQQQQLSKSFCKGQQEALEIAEITTTPTTTTTTTIPSWDSTKDPYVPLYMATPPKVPGMLHCFEFTNFQTHSFVLYI